MDTPESPTQSPQSPEEEEEDEKGLSDSELLDSLDEEDDGVISDSEIVHEEENGELAEDDEEEEAVESRGRVLSFEEEGEEENEVVPDFISDPEDEEPVGETGGIGQEDEAILLMEGDDDGPHGGQSDGEGELEEEEGEDRVIDTPQSPDSEPEQGRRFITEEDREDGEEGYGDYRRPASGDPVAGVDDDDEEEEEEEVINRAEENENQRAEERGRAVVVRAMKDDSVSVSRELDEHELDYDEEVPEEPSIPTHEEEEDEEDLKAEEEESEDKTIKKREKKPILPPSPKDGEPRKTADSKGPERMRRDSLRDKKEEDDGEIDEGEIDVSCYCSIVVVCMRCLAA